MEQALWQLLRARDLQETERTVTRVVRAYAGAEWAACFRAEGETLVCQCADGGGPVAGLRVDAALIGVENGSGAAVRPVRSEQLPGAELAIPLEVDGGPAAVVVLGHRVSGVYDAGAARELSRLGEACAVAFRNAALLEQLRSQVFVDFLTGCYNRRGFEEHLRVEMVRARRYRRTVSLLLIDLDHLKRINDDLGHPVGDLVLRGVGALLRSAFRTTDVVCRYGGDEFAVIFPETPKQEVLRLAARLRTRIAALFPGERMPREISASLGVACFPEDAQGEEELVRAADEALYRAKSEGRDQIVSA